MSAMSNVVNPSSEYRTMASTIDLRSASPHPGPLTCHIPFTILHISMPSSFPCFTVVEVCKEEEEEEEEEDSTAMAAVLAFLLLLLPCVSVAGEGNDDSKLRHGS